MIHRTLPSFWESYRALPREVQAQADAAFERLKRDTRHPSLHFKRVGDYWSVRIARRYRAVGTATDDGVLWVWIGTHGEYDTSIS